MAHIISVASYNTSWLSDSGRPNPFASEKNFLHELFNDNSEPDKRKYFKNAINNAISFWNKTKDKEEYPVIGFQEMNKREKVLETIKKSNEKSIEKSIEKFDGGAEYIVEQFTKEFGTNIFFYKSHFVTVKDPEIVPGLLTIWHKELGNYKYSYASDLNFTITMKVKDETSNDFKEKKLPHQDGRPILIVFTDKNYILINLHGPNFPHESFKNNMTNLREQIQIHLNNALKKYKNEHEPTLDIQYIINKSNIFIMGDFNDPNNSINPSDPLLLNGNAYCYSTGEEAPKSCCYNFNSSCPDDLFIGKNEVITEEKKSNIEKVTGFDKEKGDELIVEQGECAIIKNDKSPERNQGPVISIVKARSLEERGKISNYRFTGDYVLGLMNNIVQNLKIYNEGNEEISNKSDHEMVYAKFKVVDKENSIGGKLRLQKYKKTNKKRKLHHTTKYKKYKKYKKYSRKIRKTKNIRKNKKYINKSKSNRCRGGGINSSFSVYGLPLASQSSDTFRFDPETGESKPIERYTILGYQLPFFKKNNYK
jgi:hypothetical protein